MTYRIRGLCIVTASACFLACLSWGGAESLDLGLSGALLAPTATAATLGGRASLAVRGAPVAGGRVDLGVAYDRRSAGAAGQLDFGAQADHAFGPLGNVLAEGSLSVRTDRQAQAELGVRGVLGPVALGLRLSAFSADPTRFDPFAVSASARPDFGSGGFGLALDASGRPARTLVLEAHPELYLVPAGAAARATVRVRFLRAVGANELSARVLGYLAPHAAAGDAAIGVGMTVKRRQAPDIDGAFYLGWSAAGLRPGATASLGQQLGPLQVSLAVEAEPFRVDVPPYRARLGVGFSLGPGQAHLEGDGATGPGGTAATLGLRYSLPITLTP